MAVLSEKARKHKVEYNIKRNKRLTSLFAARLPKDEYDEICEFLKQADMNKAEFIRWAFNELRGI